MNAYLDVQNLTKTFGALTLFEDISFSVSEGQRIGIVAKNGVGKSTLLSIITGKEGYDNGEITYRRDLKVGYLEQSPRFDPHESVLDACFNHEGDDDQCGIDQIIYGSFGNHFSILIRASTAVT